MEQKKLEFDCRKKADQIDVATNHEIEEDIFKDYLANFWGERAGEVESVKKSWSELSFAMALRNCKKERWKLDYDENDTENNLIEFGFEDFDHSMRNYYSIALFKGVNAKHNASDFHFYKAIDGSNQFTIIFKVFCDTGKVMFYDLSNEIP